MIDKNFNNDNFTCEVDDRDGSDSIGSASALLSSQTDSEAAQIEPTQVDSSRLKPTQTDLKIYLKIGIHNFTLVS